MFFTSPSTTSFDLNVFSHPSTLHRIHFLKSLDSFSCPALYVWWYVSFAGTVASKSQSGHLILEGVGASREFPVATLSFLAQSRQYAYLY